MLQNLEISMQKLHIILCWLYFCRLGAGEEGLTAGELMRFLRTIQKVIVTHKPFKRHYLYSVQP